MSSRRQARKRASLQPKTTPVNPLRTRGFGKGIQARTAQLPHVNPLQTRPFGAQKPGLSPQQETHSLQEQQEQKEGTEQFGYNAANIPAYAPERSQLPIQTKPGQFGGWNPPPIQRANPVTNRLNLWRDQQLGHTETGEPEEVSEREEQDASPEAAVVQRLQESDPQPISDQGIQPQEIAEPEDKETPTLPSKTETIEPKSVSVAKTISPQTKAQLRRKLFPESQDETEKIPEFSPNVDRDQQSSSAVETYKNPLAKAKQFANLPAKVARDKKPLTSLKTNKPASLPQTFQPSEADQLIEPADTATASEVPSSSNKTLLPDTGGIPHPQPSEAKETGADETVSEQPSDKPQPEAVGKSMDTGTPPSTESNSESDRTTPTNVATESPTSATSTKADTPTPQPGANPEKSGQEAAPESTVQPDAGSVQSPETKTKTVTAPAAAINSPAAAGGGGGAGAAGGASAGGGDVEAATVDEEAEANAMDERLAQVAPETETESNQLSSAEKDVALAALAEEPATGSLPAGGGGGGGAIAESPTPPAPPEVSQADPATALGAVSGLPPAQLVSALGDVTAAVSNEVGKQKSELAANPPSADTLPGTGKSAVVKADSGGDKPEPVAKKAEGQEKPVPEPKPLPPEKAPPQVSTPAPTVQGNEEGKLSDADISNMKASVTRLPVSDPGANQVSAGLPPKLALEGNADPQKAQEQRAELETSLTEAQAKGQQELAKPTGVENIQPTIPQKSLKAQIPGGAGGGAAGAVAGAGAALATGAGGDGMGDAASIFAQQEKGGEIQAAAAQAQSDLAAKKQDHATKVAEEQATAQQEVEQLKQENITQQAQERTKAQGEVAELQGQWSKEQDDLVSQSRQEGDTLVNEGLQEVETKQAEGDAEAVKEIEKGETEAEAERQKGEAKAAEEKQKGEKESSGLFGWLASKAKAFFDGIKKAIQKAFEAARAAMRKAIETAKKLAAAAIEKARQAIVAVIRRVGDALIALGDTLLAKWPGLRDKWRSAIAKKVQQAEDTVNQLAENLNQGIQKALDVLGGALDAALGLLEKGMLAVVSVYEGVVMGAIKFGEGIAKALGAFAVLAKDIAANPGQWIGNLGAAVSDGIRNHLWSAFKEQVQTWFNQKLEAVLGLGAAIWKILTQGGIAMAEVGKMAWTAVKQALPTIIIGVLLERLVSMIVPAAGAVLAIIQGLQAAWGTVSQIIQAFGRFIEFLKAIKTGAAGPQFGALLASAAIVLLDFITNFIIAKIAKAARKVAGKLKGLAKSLMKRFKGKKGKKDKKGKKGKKDKDESRDEKVTKRVEKVKRELPPKVNSFLAKKPSKLRLKAQLAIWRVQYRLQHLKVLGDEKSKAEIEARVNPKIKIADAYFFEAADLFRIVDRVAHEYVPQEAAEESSLPDVHDSTGDPTKAMAGMLGNRQHQFATDSKDQPVGVSSTVEKDQFGNEVLKIRSFEGGPGPKYETLSKGLEGMGPEVAEYYRNIFVGQTPKALPSGKKGFADVGYGLLYVHEPGHKRYQGSDGPVPTWTNKRDLTYSMMLTELMARGEVDPKEAFSSEKLGSSRIQQGVTSHPAAFGGAQAGAKYTTRHMKRQEKSLQKGKNFKWGLGTNKNARERYFREQQLIKKWFSLHKAEFLKACPQKPSEAELEQFVRRKLREYFNRKSN